MEVLNKKERNQYFLRFVVTFLALLLLILTAVYFGYQVPIKENAHLKDKMMLQEQELLFKSDFTQLNNDVALLLDTMQVAGVNVELLEGRITAKIQQMDGLIQQYTGVDKPLYMNVVKGLSQQKQDKNTIRMGGSKEQEMADYEKRIAVLEQNRDEWKTQAEKLQMQLQMMNR